MVQIEERSFETIDKEDLKRLRDLALKDLEEFFYRHPCYKVYENSLILIALCQGAAKHFVDGKTGVKDFDVWSFFVENPSVRLPYRRWKQLDSELNKFGVHSNDAKKGYKGRHVDLFMRTIKADIVKRKRDDPKGCINEYLKQAKSTSPKLLAEKTVIGLYPNTILGEVLYHRN